MHVCRDLSSRAFILGSRQVEPASPTRIRPNLAYGISWGATAGSGLGSSLDKPSRPDFLSTLNLLIITTTY